MSYSTEQEAFWAGEFGDDYLIRNQGEDMISSNLNLFSRILTRAPEVRSIAELGCNVGMNLRALNRLRNNFELRGYEIHAGAAAKARELGIADIVNDTVVKPLPVDRQFDLAFTKGVLIHIHPEMLAQVYENLVALSSRYVLISEYYNPTPVSVSYRGNQERLFKRDFAGEIMDRYGLSLVDYGFCYGRDSYFTNDDSTWFLMEKSR